MFRGVARGVQCSCSLVQKAQVAKVLDTCTCVSEKDRHVYAGWCYNMLKLCTRPDNYSEHRTKNISDLLLSI